MGMRPHLGRRWAEQLRGSPDSERAHAAQARARTMALWQEDRRGCVLKAKGGLQQEPLPLPLPRPRPLPARAAGGRRREMSRNSLTQARGTVALATFI